jgi:hypothetical protein
MMMIQQSSRHQSGHHQSAEEKMMQKCCRNCKALINTQTKCRWLLRFFFNEFPSFVQIGNKLLHLEGKMFEHHEGNEGFNRIGRVLNHRKILV